ncbi:hypothetical protein [Methylobacterium sp. D54C]
MAEATNTAPAGAAIPLPECKIWCGRRICEDRGCDGKFPEGAPPALNDTELSQSLSRLSARAPAGEWHLDPNEAHDENGGPAEVICDGIVTYDGEDDAAGRIASCGRRVGEYVCALVKAHRAGRLTAPAATFPLGGDDLAKALRSELERLSAAATSGEWHLDFFPFRDMESGEAQSPRCEGICTHDETGGLAEDFVTCDEPDARFIVALVNAYRSGKLVASTGSEEETKGEPVQWGDPKTVAGLIAQLRTLPPGAPIYGTFHGPDFPEDGRRRTGVRGVTLSREYVKGRWMSRDPDAELQHVIWTKPAKPAEMIASAPSPEAGAGGDLRELARLSEAATPGAWYTVDTPWGDGTWLVAGSPDPHAGTMVCDCQDVNESRPEDGPDAADDAALIAASVNFVRRLLARSRPLHAGAEVRGA